jgi:hypothetical protein
MGIYMDWEKVPNWIIGLLGVLFIIVAFIPVLNVIACGIGVVLGLIHMFKKKYSTNDSSFSYSKEEKTLLEHPIKRNDADNDNKVVTKNPENYSYGKEEEPFLELPINRNDAEAEDDKKVFSKNPENLTRVETIKGTHVLQRNETALSYAAFGVILLLVCLLLFLSRII